MDRAEFKIQEKLEEMASMLGSDLRSTAYKIVLADILAKPEFKFVFSKEQARPWNSNIDNKHMEFTIGLPHWSEEKTLDMGYYFLYDIEFEQDLMMRLAVDLINDAFACLARELQSLESNINKKEDGDTTEQQ